MSDNEGELAAAEFAAELMELIETSRDDVEEVELAESGDTFTVALDGGALLRVSVKYLSEAEE